MKKGIFQLAMMMTIASTAFAIGSQGEVITVDDNQIVIEVFGDEEVSFKIGEHVRLKIIPKGVPTLDMLKG